MKSSVSHLILIALMLTLLECVLCYNYRRDEDPSVNQRLDRLENEMEILTNEVDKLLSESESSEDDQGESTQQHGVTVLEVRREKEGEMIKFTVNYDSREENVVTRWFGPGMAGGHEEFRGIKTAVGNGVYETSASFPLPVPGNDSEELSFYERDTAWILLGISDEIFVMELNLTDHEAVDREIPTQQLEIEPDGDFVYQEGEEFSFMIIIPRSSTDEDGPSSGMANLYVSAVLLDPGTGEVVSKGQSEFLEFGEKKQFQNYEEVTARIKGTENGISGLIHLSSRVRIYNSNDVVNSVDRGRTVILRPSTQEGPFPDGFLGFVEMRAGAGGESGEDVICRLGEDCYYGCGAAGSDIIDVTVTRIKADGSYQNLENFIPGRKTPYLEYKEGFFHIDYVPEEPEKIRCVVENANGKLISKEANLVVSIPVDIIEEESGIVLINGAEDAASRSFEISCTVTGSPQPNVTFTVHFWNPMYNQEPDDIIERGDDKYTMIKTVTYNTEDVERSWFYLNVECDASRDSPWSYVSYSMSYDSNNLN